MEKTFVGSDCVKNFFQYLKDNASYFQNLQNPQVPAFRYVSV